MWIKIKSKLNLNKFDKGLNKDDIINQYNNQLKSYESQISFYIKKNIIYRIQIESE